MHSEDVDMVDGIAAVQIEDEAGASMSDGSDDDFGDFNEDTGTASRDLTTGDDVQNLNTPTETVHSNASAVSEAPLNLNKSGPKPVKISEISELSIEDIRQTLTKPPVLPGSELAKKYDEELGDGTTATSQTLWQHLTEASWLPLPKWEGSPIHRQLVVNLGIPLNLDASLPASSGIKENMNLPTQKTSNDIEGMQHVPEWTLLSNVSQEALQRMSESELEDHLSHLQEVIDEANTLKDAIESKEMDLLGEKNILEGMVESLLIFSQRKQRERLQRKVSKSRR